LEGRIPLKEVLVGALSGHRSKFEYVEGVMKTVDLLPVVRSEGVLADGWNRSVQSTELDKAFLYTPCPAEHVVEGVPARGVVLNKLGRWLLVEGSDVE
jgi:hypothetical protein